jgi:hypothetical protein
MGQVARLPHVPPTVGTAVDNYLDGVELALTTRRVYTASLTGLAGGLGPDTRLGEVDAATVEGWFPRGRPPDRQTRAPDCALVTRREPP